jgi:hypothetical protein
MGGAAAFSRRHLLRSRCPGGGNVVAAQPGIHAELARTKKVKPRLGIFLAHAVKWRFRSVGPLAERAKIELSSSQQTEIDEPYVGMANI